MLLASEKKVLSLVLLMLQQLLLSSFEPLSQLSWLSAFSSRSANHVSTVVFYFILSGSAAD